MIWVSICGLAGLAAILARFAFGLPRSSLPLFSATLLFGLTGYALQGHPRQPSAPGVASEQAGTGGEAMVEARRAIFDSGRQPSPLIVVADGFARRGQYLDAAQILQGVVAKEPDNPETWTALGNVLVEHAGGLLTPAAMQAYGRADAVGRGHPGPGYFLGIALLRSGRPGDARALWAQMLVDAPADAPWKDELAQRLERLDELIAQMQNEPRTPGGAGN